MSDDACSAGSDERKGGEWDHFFYILIERWSTVAFRMPVLVYPHGWMINTCTGGFCQLRELDGKKPIDQISYPADTSNKDRVRNYLLSEIKRIELKHNVKFKPRMLSRNNSKR